jgi:hypothetical protein
MVAERSRVEGGGNLLCKSRHASGPSPGVQSQSNTTEDTKIENDSCVLSGQGGNGGRFFWGTWSVQRTRPLKIASYFPQ